MILAFHETIFENSAFHILQFGKSAFDFSKFNKKVFENSNSMNLPVIHLGHFGNRLHSYRIHFQTPLSKLKK